MTARALPAVAQNRKAANLVRNRLVGSAMFSEPAWQAIARSLKLSGRELQIVRGAFDDQTEFALAGNLGIAPRTIHTHIERLHLKLAVATRSQLVLRVVAEFLALTAAPDSLLPSICANRTTGRCPLRPNKPSPTT